MAVTVGQRLRYLARHVGAYDADVRVAHADGTVDLEILSDRGTPLLAVTGIRVAASAGDARPGECFRSDGLG